MLFVSRTCFNEFLLLLDVMWVNKVLMLLLLLLLRLLRIGKVSVTARKKKAFRSRKRRKHSKAPKKLSTSMSVQKLAIFQIRLCYDTCERSSIFTASFLRICQKFSLSFSAFCAVIGTFLLE